MVKRHREILGRQASRLRIAIAGIVISLFLPATLLRVRNVRSNLGTQSGSRITEMVDGCPDTSMNAWVMSSTWYGAKALCSSGTLINFVGAMMVRGRRLQHLVEPRLMVKRQRTKSKPVASKQPITKVNEMDYKKWCWGVMVYCNLS